MDLGLTDKVFVVTAASSGLGRASATQLVAEGSRVVLVARRGEVLAEVVTELGADRAVSLTADLADPGSAARACRLALDTYGRLDGALVSVGGPPAGSVLGTTEQQWTDAFASVFLPALRVTNAVVEHSESTELAVAWVLSTSVKAPIGGLAASNGLRPGLAMLIKQLADELGPRGTRVLGLMPGRIETERVRHLDSLSDDPAAARSRRRSRHPAAPLRRPGGVRPRRRLRPLPRGLLPDRVGDPGRRRRPAQPVTGGSDHHSPMSVEQILDLVRCPLCRGGFALDGRSVRCPAGHSFDLARQGYLNLLGRAAPAHADTAAMVAARARFLSGGHYGPVAGALVQTVAAQSSAVDPAVLEVGAGTGSYVAGLLGRRGGRGVALDISTAAARHAARAHRRLAAVVADVWADLPLTDEAYDVVLAVFAPRNPAEFVRVLRRDGVLVVVTPQADHLAELRTSLGLLQIEPDKDERLTATLQSRFQPVARTDVRFSMSLDPATVVDLVAMGPNAFHRSPGELAGTVGTDIQTVTGAVTVSAWEASVTTRGPANWVR